MRYPRFLVSPPFLLAAATFCAFLACLRCDFINYDDVNYYFSPGTVITELSWEGLRRIFTESFGVYHPLALLSFMVEYRFFGADPFVCHLTNLCLHILNVLLVYRIFRKLSEGELVAFVTALLFAIHPMHVEPVAWVSARKDLLYSFFYLCALSRYLDFLRTDRSDAYIHSLVLFILSALSKPMAITLPAVLWLVRPMPWKKMAPFIFISFLIAARTLGTHPLALVSADKSYGLAQKLLDLCYAPVFYLYKSLWPFHFSFLYTHPRYYPSPPFEYTFAPAILAAAALVLVRVRRLFPPLAFGAAFFITTLFPILPFFIFTATIVTDHYNYLASLGIFFPVAAGLDRVARSGIARPYKMLVLAGCALAVAGLFFLTFAQCQIWKDSETLYTHTIRNQPASALAYLKRGDSFFEKGDYDAAISDYSRAVELRPGTLPTAFHNRAVCYIQKGELDKALSDLETAIRTDPGRQTLSIEHKAELIKSMGNQSQSDTMQRLRKKGFL